MWLFAKALPKRLYRQKMRHVCELLKRVNIEGHKEAANRLRETPASKNVSKNYSRCTALIINRDNDFIIFVFSRKMRDFCA